MNRSMCAVLFMIGALVLSSAAIGQAEEFNGIGLNLGNLYRLSKAESRSISPENFSGEKGKGGMAITGTGAGCARDLGQGWKISPSVVIPVNSTFELADITGPGAIQQIWMTASFIT